jgi:alpha-L-rhamnosidase
MIITNLQCEYRSNPLGIDNLSPRLSWILDSDQRGQCQTAYQILAASSLQNLQFGIIDIWDSGKVNSADTFHIIYQGKNLQSRQRVWWEVCIWDKDDQPGEFSQPGWWEMGLLDPGEWVGDWIGSSLVGGPRTMVPAPFIRKEFSVVQPFVSARLYATALGLYEFEINGKRVGDDIFTPGWTDYSKKVQYQVYDVTECLQQGQNAIGAKLGDGWYCGFAGWRDRQRSGDRPKLLSQLEITFRDGKKLVIPSDSSWKTAFGPILQSDLLMGESYDARLDFPGWSQPDFNDQKWRPAEIFQESRTGLVAQIGPTVKKQEELRPISAPMEQKSWPVSQWIFDMGQNMVGWVRLKAKAAPGTTIRLRFGEILNPNGTLYTQNLRSALQTDYFTLRGSGDEIFETHFTFHGFRYVEMSGYPGVPTKDMVTGIVLHSDMPVTGKFECSDPLINQLQHNILWGQKGNFVDVPTDCPQRDERLGWTGDAQVFIRTATFNMDVAAFFERYQQNLTDAQSPIGQFPMVAPNPGIAGIDGGPAWSDAGIICPWTIYQQYGDKYLLELHYESMSRFIQYLESTSCDFIRTYPGWDGFEGFGDWLSINADTPKDLIGTAFFAYSVSLMVKIAGILGKDADVERYQKLYEGIRQSFINHFVTAQGMVVGNTQTAYVLALHFDLLPEHLRSTAADALVRDIKRRGMHLSTGFVGSPYLPFVLTRFGYLDIAYQLLNQKTWPSWLYSVTQGATTIWERWDGWTTEKGFQDPGMNSFNHYAYGSIGEWLYRIVAGIDLAAENPGYRHIIINPNPGGGLDYVKAEYHSAVGTILSEWRVENDRFSLDVFIPTNTIAIIYIPARKFDTITEVGGMEGVHRLRYEKDRAVFQVLSGRYSFSSEL